MLSSHFPFFICLSLPYFLILLAFPCILNVLHPVSVHRPPPTSCSVLLFPVFVLSLTLVSSSFCRSAGTQTGEEIPIVSRSNIKEFKDSFSNENFDFRNSPNITFFVYVSNFTWPIKIQVSFSSSS